MADTYYRPGLRFKVKPGPHGGGIAHQEICFAGKPPVFNADGSLQQEEIRMLVAEFGVLGTEYRPTDANGEPVNDLYDGTPLVFADIRGGFFDLDVQAQDKGWTGAEKERVARHMLRKLNDADCLFLLAEAAPVAAPWPTYDTTHHKQIPTLAAQLGLVGPALLYESQNKKRTEILEKLRDAASSPAPADDESLIAA